MRKCPCVGHKLLTAISSVYFYIDSLSQRVSERARERKNNFKGNLVYCGKSVSVGVGFSEASSRRGRSSFAVDGRTNSPFVRRAK